MPTRREFVATTVGLGVTAAAGLAAVKGTARTDSVAPSGGGITGAAAKADIVISLQIVDGELKQHFAVHGPLHSPWGLAQAPGDFGPMSNAILVSNNIPRGRINAFDPGTGAFLGPIRDATGKPIEIDGVWALQFGQDGGPNGAHNQLFFTAGPNNYANGLFGVITFEQ